MKKISFEGARSKRRPHNFTILELNSTFLNFSKISFEINSMHSFYSNLIPNKPYKNKTLIMVSEESQGVPNILDKFNEYLLSKGKIPEQFCTKILIYSFNLLTNLPSFFVTREINTNFNVCLHLIFLRQIQNPYATQQLIFFHETPCVYI